MMRNLLFTAAGLAMMSATSVSAQEAPFGSTEDTEYAALLWEVMETLNLAGEGAITSFPYPGTDPHGMMLETFYTKATVNGHTGDLVVKRNYGPVGVTVDQVQMDSATHLAAVTVMFRREAGFDADNKDWFWVKYLPDGSLDKNPAGRELAGRVAKGADAGCIACHTAAGEDMLFTTDAIKY